MRDNALLESANESACATFDGNKRIGLCIMLSFLDINSVKTEATNDDVVTLGLSVAGASAKFEQILNGINTHKIN